VIADVIRERARRNGFVAVETVGFFADLEVVGGYERVLSAFFWKYHLPKFAMGMRIATAT
jgi:hypothetical protein